MAYEFKAEEHVTEAFARCAREQLDRALDELREGAREDPVEAVHAARKAIKKERSLLRLARASLPTKLRRGENAALRDAARGLSDQRDADVLVETLDGVSERYAGQLPEHTFAAIRERLAVANGAGAAPPELNPGSVQSLEALRGRMDEWSFSGNGWMAIESGVLRSYRRGRHGFTRAREHASVEDLHEWRKRVKDLWYHERLLAAVCGPTVKGHAKDAHGLADRLGDDHDLAMLRRRIEQERSRLPVDVDAVLRLVDHRREQLQGEAFHLGERVYAEPANAFKRRMKRSWRAARAQRDPAALAEATRIQLTA